ncbi:MAG: 4Fe-4S dicluster domain-containing protein, partial [Planctomycetota bacterium]
GAHQPEYLGLIADDILKHKGRVAITVGAAQPPEAHALAAVLNRALQSSGSAVRYVPEPDPDRPTHVSAIRALADEIDAGAVETLVILGGNPAYDAPADLNLAEKIAHVAVSVRLGQYDDETSRQCTWAVPQAHFLEAWGDAIAWDGTYSVAQPLIAPLYDGRTPGELLALLAGEKQPRAYDQTRRTFAERFGADDLERRWRHALHDGLVEESAPEPSLPAIVTSVDWDAALSNLSEGWEPLREDGDRFELAFYGEKLYDGRFANNAWLQELPGLLTKLTWDNAAVLSPADAQRLHVVQDDLVELEVGGRTLRLPVFVLPGQARGSIALALGYGRRAGGPVAMDAGFDTYRLRTSETMYASTGATLKRLRGTHKLATTQDHHAIQSDVGRKETQHRIPLLIREGTLKQYQADPKFVRHIGHPLPLVDGKPPQPFGDHEFEGKPRWAMAIDLAKCTGCSACVTACQAENNVPVVGREEVINGREMHWIRVDRYFKGDPSDANTLDVRHQPVTCVQCENAPCEQVCPVAATVHDQEGLNVMVYNRCIGTRYCLNNCPYKVRRFNWFFNHHGPSHPRNKDGWFQTKLTAVEKLVFNPEVTVRTRGVMEKCSFCVQRIAAVKIPARNERREIADGEIVTACQQACPADAISFGDLNHGSSRVARQHEHDRAYVMLEDLNIRPRTKYLAGLRNPVHEPAAAHDAGHAAEAHH